MSKTNAQAQRDYRKRAKTEGDGQRRVDAWLPSPNFSQLNRLAAHYRASKREILIMLLDAEEKKLTQGMSDDEFNNYINI